MDREDLPAAKITYDAQRRTYVVGYKPLPRQQVLHSTCASQILFGGAAGGSKSTGIRWDAYIFCLQNPGLRAYLFRRTRPELKRNHIDFIRDEVPQELAHYDKANSVLEFQNGSRLYFCFCDSDEDAKLYQGAEVHWLGLDEATHFTKFMITYLRGRLRLGSFVPETEGELAVEVRDTDDLVFNKSWPIAPKAGT